MHRLALALGSSLVLLGCTPASTPTTDPGAATSPAPPTTETTASTPPATPPATAAGTCSLGPFATWPTCESQRVAIRGTQPQHVHQHPIIATPAFDGQPEEHQGYMDVPDATQIIVLTREPIACQAGMVATGTLRRIEAKVDKAVKSLETYGNWYLDDATVECD